MLTESVHRKKHRRIANTWLNIKAVDAYNHILDFEAKDMIKSMYLASNGGKLPINPQVGRCSQSEAQLVDLTMNAIGSFRSLLAEQHALHYLRLPDE